MAFTEMETKRHEKSLENFLHKFRPKLKNKYGIDLSYMLVNQTIEIFRMIPRIAIGRPIDLSDQYEDKIAKATFVKSKNHWKIYCCYAYVKWLRHRDRPTVRTLNEFYDEVYKEHSGVLTGESVPHHLYGRY
jgi:hypothetical protein